PPAAPPAPPNRWRGRGAPPPPGVVREAQALSTRGDVSGEGRNGHGLRRTARRGAELPDPPRKEHPVTQPDHGRHEVRQSRTGEVRVIPEPAPPHALGDNVDHDRFPVVSAQLHLEQTLQPNLKPVATVVR